MLFAARDKLRAGPIGEQLDDNLLKIRDLGILDQTNRVV